MGGRHERTHLLVPRLNKLGISFGAIQRPEEPINAIAPVTVDPVDTPLGKPVQNIVGNLCHAHRPPRSSYRYPNDYPPPTAVKRCSFGCPTRRPDSAAAATSRGRPALGVTDVKPDAFGQACAPGTTPIRRAAVVDLGLEGQLPPEVNVDVVVESLLHLHHNRAIGIDPDSERTCRRLARQAAITWRARSSADPEGAG
jgi:hypothetical protein